MDRVLFGDNQFFGVNHMSEEKARAQSMRFQELGAIIEVLDAAYEEGIRTFMCTSHDRVADICDHFRAHPEKYPDYRFYPCMPYAHKYANAVTEHGMIEALRMLLPQEGAVAAMLKGGVALAKKDIEAIMQLLIDAEMKMFHGLSTPVVFMQNVITDLLLGLRMNDCFRIFHDHVKNRYGAEPAYITMNVPRLLDVLDALGIDNPIVCANINKIGFRMCGGVAAYEEAIAKRRFRPIAMSVFASGAIAPREAIAYVCGQPRIESIVFGASGRGEHSPDELAHPRAERPPDRFIAARSLHGERMPEEATTTAGMPTTVAPAGTSSSTTALAPISASSPTTMPPSSLASAPMSTWPPRRGTRPRRAPSVTCCKMRQLGPISTSLWMTTPFGCGSSSPPPMRQPSEMSAPVTMLQKRCLRTSQRRCTTCQGRRESPMR